MKYKTNHTDDDGQAPSSKIWPCENVGDETVNGRKDKKGKVQLYTCDPSETFSVE